MTIMYFLYNISMLVLIVVEIGYLGHNRQVNIYNFGSI